MSIRKKSKIYGILVCLICITLSSNLQYPWKPIDSQPWYLLETNSLAATQGKNSFGAPQKALFPENFYYFTYLVAP